MSHWNHGFSNHLQVCCLFNSLFWLTNEIEVMHNWPFVRGIHHWPMNSNHKWPIMCHCVMVGVWHVSCLLTWYLWHSIPDSKVHGANMGPIWGRQDPGGPQVGPMNLAILECFCRLLMTRRIFTLLALHEVSPLVDSPHIGPAMWSFDVAFVVDLKLLDNQSSCQWFKKP